MKAKFFILGLVLLVLVIAISGCPQPPQPPPDGNGNGNGNGNGAPDGMSFETAIVIDADNTDDGIAMEYEYLYEHACADKDGPLEVVMQELDFQNDHTYDIMHVMCNNGEEEVYYFQIDSFFGKWE